MEQLPLTFVQSTVEPDIQECFTPAYNFTKLSSSNGRLAFTTGKIYWLPDNPIALMDQGWVLNISEVAGCDKYGLTGFIIRLTDGKELRFSNVGAKMRDGISEAIEAHRSDKVADECPSVNGTRAVFLQCINMFFCPVSFVAGKTVFRIKHICFSHLSVTNYFRNNTCRIDAV